MANTLPLQHILDLTFNVLTAAVGIVVIFLGLRITSTLTLSTHRRALWISFAAVALIVASNIATVWANFSRTSTFKDVGGAVAELVAVCSVGWAVRLLNRAEKEEVSSLRREANMDELTGLGNRCSSTERRNGGWSCTRETVCRSPAPYSMSTTSSSTTTTTGTKEGMRFSAA